MAEKQWHGVGRSNFVWHPTIDESKCTNCGLCLLSCGSGVFAWVKAENKYIVANPGNCAVGCTTCGRVCPETAITFPEAPEKFVKRAMSKYKVLPTVKKELQARLEKFPDHVIKGGDTRGEQGNG